LNLRQYFGAALLRHCKRRRETVTVRTLTEIDVVVKKTRSTKFTTLQ